MESRFNTDIPPAAEEEYISCPDVHDQEAFAVRMAGDAMLPRYSPGDIIIFSPAAEPRDGDDCFIRFIDGQCMFRRAWWKTRRDGKRVLWIRGRGKRQAPRREVAVEEVAGIYKAVCCYHRIG